MNVAQETLGLRRAGFSPALSLLMSAFALPMPPARVPPHLHRPTERSPTASEVRCQISDVRASRARTRTQTLQHLGDLLVLIMPSVPVVLIDVAQIYAVAQPHSHLFS